MTFPEPLLPGIELHCMETGPLTHGRPRAEAERRAVMKLISRRFGPQASLVHDAHGAPSIAGRPEPISISHGAGRAILAVGRRGMSVGIDIECWREQLARVAPRFLTPAERQRIATPAALLQAWTAKEAAFKAAGIPGLTMSAIETSPGFFTAAAATHRFEITFIPIQEAMIAIASTPLRETPHGV